MTPAPRRRVRAALLALLVVLAACSSGPDPRERLLAATDEVVQGPFLARLRPVLPDDVLAALAADEAGALPVLLAGATLDVVSGAGGTGLELALAGESLVSARDLGDGELLIRVDAGALVRLLGGTPSTTPDALRDQLAGSDLDAAVVDAVVAALDGGWVALPGATTGQDPALGVGEALRTLLAAGTVGATAGDLSRERPDAQVELRVTADGVRAALDALLGDVAAAPSPGEGATALPLRALLRDGALRLVEVDVGALLPEPVEGDVVGAAARATTLELEVLATGAAVPQLRRPDDVVTLAPGVLEAALATLAELGLLGPAP